MFGERLQEFAPESIEGSILSILNGSLSERVQFIRNVVLGNAGFRPLGNTRFRRTDGAEKTLSVLHMVTRGITFGFLPMPARPFSEIEYERLPDGVFYSFQTVISSSDLHNVSPIVLLVLEIEYKLQIEFANGLLLANNRNYLTEENISIFEKLIFELPEYPESIQRLRERYLNIELPRIRNSLERHLNPSENHLRALENLSDWRVIRD
ncbi:MAG: hypothetical protein FWD28_01775 [Treponema sp.]|nr:hypothetical protein [Treponema sp.]